MLAIGVLARSLRTFRGGVDAYIEAIIRHAAPAARARGHRFLAYVDDAEVARRLEGGGCEVAIVPMGPLGRLAWDHVASVRRARADAIDVLICPRSFRPVWTPCASVAVVYDMMYFDARAALRASDHAAYFRALHRLALHRSQAIAVFSRFTRDRVLANLPRVPADRVHVLPPGPPDGAFRPADPAEVQAVLARLGVDAPYALVVGAHPRKNVDVVLRAMREVAAPMSLVVVAPTEDGDPIRRLADGARALGLGERLRVVTAIARSDLAALYAGAAVSIYASGYEGIGIPPLEAMACGCPVIVARTGAVPEVVGDAALAVAPGDAPALAAAIRSLLERPGDAAELRRKGRERLAAFDWGTTARELLDLVERAAR